MIRADTPTAALVGTGMVADMHVAAVARTQGSVRLKGVYSRTPDFHGAYRNIRRDSASGNLLTARAPHWFQDPLCDLGVRGGHVRGRLAYLQGS